MGERSSDFSWGSQFLPAMKPGAVYFCRRGSLSQHLVLSHNLLTTLVWVHFDREPDTPQAVWSALLVVMGDYGWVAIFLPEVM